LAGVVCGGWRTATILHRHGNGGRTVDGEDLAVTQNGLVRSRGRILLLDDDADAVLFATHVLAAGGHFTVEHTADPSVALRAVARDGCDLVLTEADLPGLNCRELVTAMRQLAPRLPIVVLTACLQAGAEADALCELTDSYLTKPVPADQLLATVTRLL
jgi:DNA-binding response OmpR family regulator